MYKQFIKKKCNNETQKVKFKKKNNRKRNEKN